MLLLAFNLNSAENYEYEVKIKNKTFRFFLDFFVKDTNKVIEFDGDYWHSGPLANLDKLEFREKTLISLGFDIFHIKESEYRSNKEEVIERCLHFLNGDTNESTAI